jgi:hypothetical protein
MKLINLEVIPVGPNGWGSGKLEFSSFITQLFGENGTGKTPIVKSISYALGNDCEFRDEIYAKCKCVTLRLEKAGDFWELTRTYSKRFDAVVTQPDGTALEFSNEGDYTDHILELFGLSSRRLVSSRGEAVNAYMTCLLPLFYAEQNEGYSNFYRCKSSFIKDQMVEMIRLSAGLALKNSFARVRDKTLASEKVDLAIKDYVRTQRQYEKILERIDTPYADTKEIKERIEILNDELMGLESANGDVSDAVDLIDNDIREQKRLISKLRYELEEIRRYINSNNKVAEEIESETDTLSLNEEAKRVFMSFDEICSVEGCGMFLKSSEAYVNNLIYLKDQIKDLKLISNSANVELKKKSKQYSSAREKLDNLLVVRSEEAQKTPVSSTLGVVRRLTKEIVKLEYALSLLEEQEKIEKSLVEKEFKRKTAEEYLESLNTKSGSETAGVIKFKSRLQKLLPLWISKLNTVNVPGSVEIQNDFRAKFAGEALSKFDGSTRLRIVLAYHAALIQTIAETNPNGIRFLILDTPAQHNISSKDLDEYVKALRDLATKMSIQVIFSTTEYRYEEQDGDITWEATYKGFEQLMYLGQQPQ